MLTAPSSSVHASTSTEPTVLSFTSVSTQANIPDCMMESLLVDNATMRQQMSEMRDELKELRKDIRCVLDMMSHNPQATSGMPLINRSR